MSQEIALGLEPPAQTHNDGDRLLRRIGDHEQAIDRVRRDMEAQMAEIHEWARAEITQHERAIAILKARLEPYVQAEIAANPLQRRSASFPAGRAGYRSPSTRVEIAAEDLPGFVAWAERHRPHWLRHPPPEVAKAAIRDEAVETADGCLCVPGEEPGELIPVPGVRLVHGVPTFYVSTGAGGRR